MKELSFYLVTDTHYFEPSLGASGAAYDEYMKHEQMCLAENSAVAHAVFDAIVADKTTDIVIMPGDLVKNGERASHISFIGELNRLREAGKRVYVITALHDFHDSPSAFAGDERIKVEGTRREELAELYDKFGFCDALEVDGQSMSYVAQLEPGVRMLALNCDGDGEACKGCFDERLIAWIKEQIIKAKQDNCFVFAINHYPILPPAEIFDLVGDAKVKDWRTVAAMLADMGVPIAFTGHMHIQSINKFTSPAGNEFYDVCTSALVGSPAKYRHITIKDEHTVVIKSLPVPPFEWDMQGLSNDEYFGRQFDGMILSIVESMRDDYDYFMRRIGAQPKKALKPVVTLAGKIVNSITLGGVGRLLWIKVDKGIKKTLVRDFAVAIVRNLFAGDQPFVEGTPEHEVMLRFTRRIAFALRKLSTKLSKNGITYNLSDMIMEAIGNSSGICDNDETLILK